MSLSHNQTDVLKRVAAGDVVYVTGPSKHPGYRTLRGAHINLFYIQWLREAEYITIGDTLDPEGLSYPMELTQRGRKALA